MKAFCMAILFILLTSPGFSQTPDSLNFFPAHAGDVRQYRSFYTGEVTMTIYYDKDSIDQYGNKFVWQRGSSGGYKIDTLNDVYGFSVPSSPNPFPIYKLDADSGTSWMMPGVPESLMTKVTWVFTSTVFSKPVTVKKYEFYFLAGYGPFWLGNRYLATGFGMVQWDIEPSDTYVLSGAIINGVEYGTIVSVAEEPLSPKTFDMLCNYPNPFNSTTVINYRLSVSGYVNLRIFNLLGQEVAALVSEKKQAGSYTIHWNAQGMPSGVYFAVMRTKSKTLTHKLLALK